MSAENNDEKLILLAKVIKKERKKNKTMKKLLVEEIEKNEVSQSAFANLKKDLDTSLLEISEKDERIAKAYSSYTMIYDELSEIKSENQELKLSLEKKKEKGFFQKFKEVLPGNNDEDKTTDDLKSEEIPESPKRRMSFLGKPDEDLVFDPEEVQTETIETL